MPWFDESGAPVTDPLLTQSLGTPAAPPTGKWLDPSGKPVVDPLILHGLGVQGAPAGDQQGQTIPIAGGQEPDVAPQMTGTAREIALPASALAKGALQGLGAPGDLLGGAFNAYTKYIGAPFAGMITGKPQEPMQMGGFLDSAGLTGAGRQLGITDRPDLVPTGARERYEAAGLQGVGGALPYAMFGGVPALASAAVQGGSGGLGAQAARDILPNSPVAELAGSLLGMKAGGAGLNVATKAANLARGELSPLSASYRRLGIDRTLVGDVTEAPQAQQFQSFASNAPGGVGRMRSTSDRVVGQFGAAVDRTADALGASRTEQQAGTTLQSEARNWNDTVFPQRQAAAWAPVDAAVGPQAPVPLDGYRQALTNVTGQFGRLRQSGAQLIPPRAQALLDSLNADLPSGGPATWQEAQKLRSAVGDAMGVPEIAQSIGAKNLARIYGSLTGDMRDAAALRGAGDAFDAANQVSTRGFAFRDNVLSKVIKSNNPLQEEIAPERAASAILNSGDTSLQALRAELPRATDELAAFKLRDMALATPGRQNARQTQTSVGTFHTELSNLRLSSPGAATALFGADPRAAQAVDDLSHVASSMKDTAAYTNTSKTASHNQLAGMIGLTEAVPAAWAGYEAGGVPGAVAGGLGATVLPFVAGNVLARGVTSPFLTKLGAAPGMPALSEAQRNAIIFGTTYPNIR